MQKLPIFGRFCNCKKWNLVKKNREIDLFDFTSFLAWTFLNFPAHCVLIFYLSILGNDLPRRFGQFPEHLASVPIVDIDPYYRDKKTFIVLSNKGSIFRFFAGKALFVLSPFHPIRRIAIRVLVHPIFSLIVILTILANCYVMILPDSE